MNAPPSVSVIMPAYRATPYLKEALESAAAQTFTDFELLIITDGETDPYEDRIPGSLRSRVRSLTIAHAGVSAARNHGIMNARGRFIAFLDSDDVWLPRKLNEQVLRLEARPAAGLVYTNCYWIDKSGRTLKRTQLEQRGKLPSGKVAADLLEGDYIITSSLMTRREVFDRSGFFDTSLEVCEDWELKMRLAEDFEAEAITEPLIYYRLHPGGAHYRCAPMLEQGYKVFEKHFEKIMPGSALKDKLKANIPLNLAGSLIYIDKPELAGPYLAEAFRLNKTNPRLYLMAFLSRMPRAVRNMLLWLRDTLSFIPV